MTASAEPAAPDRGRRSVNELVGLMALPVLLFGAGSGVAIWLSLTYGLCLTPATDNDLIGDLT